MFRAHTVVFLTMDHSYTSKYIEEAVQAFSKFPGIGKKTALRLVLFLLNHDKKISQQLIDAVHNLNEKIQKCVVCHNLSDSQKCSICSNPKRDTNLICVVEDMRDVIAIENTRQYNGRYHVLNGLISPINGIGPEKLFMDQLIKRIENEKPTEIIVALSATMDGDMTSFYLVRKMQETAVKITTLSKGIAIGGELEYADEVTLGRSILNRIPVK